MQVATSAIQDLTFCCGHFLWDPMTQAPVRSNRCMSCNKLSSSGMVNSRTVMAPCEHWLHNRATWHTGVYCDGGIAYMQQRYVNGWNASIMPALGSRGMQPGLLCCMSRITVSGATAASTLHHAIHEDILCICEDRQDNALSGLLVDNAWLAPSYHAVKQWQSAQPDIRDGPPKRIHATSR